jgi:hypothetical protein
MRPQPADSRRRAKTRFRALPAAIAALCLVAGCETPPRPDPDQSDELRTYLRLVMPASIKIQRFLTQPVSFAGNGTADGLEVILGAVDSAGDNTKVVGTLQFNLETRRMSDRIGTRVAFWEVEINTREAMMAYVDRPSPFYLFPLRLDGEPLKPGQYALTARLHLPTGDCLVDEYVFTYDGSGVPPARTR